MDLGEKDESVGGIRKADHSRLYEKGTSHEIAVVVRQVPDLIEPLEIDPSGAALDLGSASFIVNESDDHALEQAILLKEAGGRDRERRGLGLRRRGQHALYGGRQGGRPDRQDCLWTATPPPPRAAAALYRRRPSSRSSADLVLVGVQAHDELDGGLSPFLAAALGLPYVGVIRGVKAGARAGHGHRLQGVSRRRHGAVEGQVAGRAGHSRRGPTAPLRSRQPHPRGDEVHAVRGTGGRSPVRRRLPLLSICRLYPPASGSRAEMLSGSEAEVAARIAEILAEKGLVK